MRAEPVLQANGFTGLDNLVTVGGDVYIDGNTLVPSPAGLGSLRTVGSITIVQSDFEDLQGLETALADVYHGNFSVFQSLPDSWAIEQLFPVMPIHRLDEEPTRMGVIADLTCDSDGKIDRFIDMRETRRALPLHEVEQEQDYILGVFLVGAYQETLGDLHNLLGDTNVVGLRLGPDGQLEYTHEVKGESVADVLGYVEFDPDALLQRFRDLAEEGVKSGQIERQERQAILAAYQDGLSGYTYFENTILDKP